LYEISDTYQQAIGRALENEADAEALTRELEVITDSFAVKAEAVLGFMRGVEAEADAFKAESDRLAARGKALQANSDRLRKYLETEFRRLGLPEIKAGLNTLKFQSNPWSVEVAVDPESLPAKYQRVKVEADKTAIKADLQAGVDVPGCRLTQGQRFVIK
jgi:hypothetical protein